MSESANPPPPSAANPQPDAAAERASLDRKTRKAFQVLLIQRGRNPGVKGWEMRRYLGKDYKKIVAGREVSLDEIENKILRKMSEPRIHFAINCASVGCPVLRTEAYEGSKIDAQLEDQVQRFLANPAKFKVDADRKVVSASMILKWFKDDFNDGSDGGRLAWLSSHVGDSSTKKVLLDKDTSLEFLEYDWSLNERP